MIPVAYKVYFNEEKLKLNFNPGASIAKIYQHIGGKNILYLVDIMQ